MISAVLEISSVCSRAGVGTVSPPVTVDVGDDKLCEGEVIEELQGWCPRWVAKVSETDPDRQEEKAIQAREQREKKNRMTDMGRTRSSLMFSEYKIWDREWDWQRCFWRASSTMVRSRESLLKSKDMRVFYVTIKYSEIFSVTLWNSRKNDSFMC
jgi:hypothetical protein